MDIWDPRWQGLPQRYLHIGQGGLFVRPTVVHTVLGSCVAVVLHAPEHQVGGIFHAFLPHQPAPPLDEDGNPPFRYVDAGTEHLVRLFARRGISPNALVAKLFGGAVSMGQKNDSAVGTRNAEAARSLMAELGIPVAAERLGGDCGSKLLFHSGTGEVLLKRLRRFEEIAQSTVSVRSPAPHGVKVPQSHGDPRS